MPPSQLKRLKASLREQGVGGPQKSKKQKKQENGRSGESRVQRNAALQAIRDSFNPFEVKASTRQAKFQSTTSNAKPAAISRPGVSRSMGEEARRATLLPEIQRRNKTGGIIDRRIGENDPTMTPEERALQRFAQEKMHKKSGASLFDLEADDDDDGMALTHAGKAIDFDTTRDDFDMTGLGASDDEDDDEGRPLKRRRSSAGSDEEDETTSDVEQEGDQPARKKTKAEVMKEVMAKSKLYKYERQKTKEDDDELREELDQGMQEMLALLQGHKPAPQPKQDPSATAGMNPDRLALLEGRDREDAEREYDMRLRQMAMDKRAAPTERTKTEEELAAEEAIRLKEKEEARLRRMQGEEESEDEVADDKKAKKVADADVDIMADDDEMRDDAAEFGLPTQQFDIQDKVVLDDEDDFQLEDDLIASGSELDISEASDDEDEDDDSDAEPAYNPEEDEEDEFVRGILGGKDDNDKDKKKTPSAPLVPTGLAYTYECPRSHEELLATFKHVAVNDLPTAIQRIRALYHPSLSASNKEKLAGFSVALVDHISYMAKEKQPLGVIETVIRHIHSLSRTYPETIATAFRLHLSAMHESGLFNAGDLVILTAISSIYPTSDHFHQVVTPAITLIARWLEMTTPTPSTLPTGAFLVALCVKFQTLSKRYIPEAVRYTIKVLHLRPQPSDKELQPHVDNLLAMADLWSSKSSFGQMFAPAALTSLQKLKGQKKAAHHLSIMLQQARLRRRPLELHHHKPLPIRTSIPKFEENFNPDKHYDPDRERADAAKLRTEYKRERKGAVRELRKDANFIARESLREKKERDAAYEKKYKRLVAEIQGEEGHEAKNYEREKRMRKGKR